MCLLPTANIWVYRKGKELKLEVLWPRKLYTFVVSHPFTLVIVQRCILYLVAKYATHVGVMGVHHSKRQMCIIIDSTQKRWIKSLAHYALKDCKFKKINHLTCNQHIPFTADYTVHMRNLLPKFTYLFPHLLDIHSLSIKRALKWHSNNNRSAQSWSQEVRFAYYAARQ